MRTQQNIHASSRYTVVVGTSSRSTHKKPLSIRTQGSLAFMALRTFQPQLTEPWGRPMEEEDANTVASGRAPERHVMLLPSIGVHTSYSPEPQYYPQPEASGPQSKHLPAVRPLPNERSSLARGVISLVPNHTRSQEHYCRSTGLIEMIHGETTRYGKRFMDQKALLPHTPRAMREILRFGEEGFAVRDTWRLARYGLYLVQESILTLSMPMRSNSMTESNAYEFPASQKPQNTDSVPLLRLSALSISCACHINGCVTRRRFKMKIMLGANKVHLR
ncbi:hypothetical protein KC343_g55 [Hortaea werneckii]|nr:hypothetical protein KC343_g55 [Hortaea werneckii]